MFLSGAAVLLTGLRLLQAALRLLRGALNSRDRLVLLLPAALGFTVTGFMMGVAVPGTLQTALALFHQGI